MESRRTCRTSALNIEERVEVPESAADALAALEDGAFVIPGTKMPRDSSTARTV